MVNEEDIVVIQYLCQVIRLLFLNFLAFADDHHLHCGQRCDSDHIQHITLFTCVMNESEYGKGGRGH